MLSKSNFMYYTHLLCIHINRRNEDGAEGQEVAEMGKKQVAGGLTVPNNPYTLEKGGILVTCTRTVLDL